MNAIQKERHSCIKSVELRDENLFKWDTIISGPENTPYEGGEFKLEIEFPPAYPFKPPKVTFKTKIYHCNINSKNGNICVDLLKDNWNPSIRMNKLFLSICCLLTDPNPSDPLVPAIAKLYESNKKLHDETAVSWTKKYAI
eukprot:gene9768-2095_t